MMKLKVVFAIIMLNMAMPVSAHYLWLEQVDGQTKLYFGEYEAGLKERSGGRLDTIAAPQAFVLNDVVNPLVLQRDTDFITVKEASSAPVIAHEFDMKVKDMTKYHFGIVKPMYYARVGKANAEVASSHALDIQPIGEHRLRILLNGQPLSEAKVKVFAPNQWMQELDANAQGEVAISTPWSGLYVVEVIHLEPKHGVYQQEHYENIRHVSTLSIYR